MIFPHFKMAGFTLLPVVLAMSLIAAIAFLLNRDNGMNVNMIAKQMDSDRARYAAEAGLQAANAKVQSVSCAGGFPVIGTPIANSNFGGASYSAYATTAAGNTTSLVSTGTYNGASVTLTRNNIYVYQTIPNTYTLQPDATTGMDTYVDSTITANYGVASTLKLSNDKNMLFKFDLTAFPAGSRPISAKFSIKQNGALLSSSNFYRMTSDWVEGTGASSPLDGATWATKNGSSAWATSGGDYHPAELNSTAVINSFGSWADFDATDLMASWLSGQYPNYGMIVKSNANNSPSFISSDSATSADRPKITFSYLVPCGTTGPADPPPITNVTLNPTADSFNDSGATSANNGAATTIKTYYTPTRENRIAMQFNTSGIPTGSTIQSAKLRMYVSAVGSATTNTKSIWATAINEAWVEGTGNGTNKTCPTITAGTSWNYRTDCTNWSFIHPPNTSQAWTAMTSMPTARYGHSVVTVNNKIYAIGGMNGSTYFNKVEEYNPATNTWVTKNPMPTPRALHAAAVVNGKIYVVGGKNASTSLDKNEVYDPAIDSWTTMTKMPTARNGLSAAVVNNKIYAIGGASGILLSSPPLTTNNNEEYDPATDKWKAMLAMTTARTNLTAASANGKIYAFGGWNGSASLNKNEEYDPATDKWAGKSNLPAVADSISSAVLGNQIYLIGGYNGGAINNVRMYDIWNNNYLTKANLPIAKQKTASVAVNNRIYTMGGGSGSSAVSNHYQYDPGIPVPVATASDELTSASPLAAGFNGGWINFDLKLLAQEWVDGVRPNNGIVIYSEVADQFSINSRENSSNKPELIVTY